jgi:hypothetical protein
VDVDHHLRYLAAERQRLSEGNGTRLTPHPVAQRDTRQVLHGEIDGAVVQPIRIVDAHDSRVVELCEGTRLLKEAGYELGILSRSRREKLERYGLVHALMDRSENLSHAATANPMQ